MSDKTKPADKNKPVKDLADAPAPAQTYKARGVEAYTFDQFVQHGKERVDEKALHNGLPWAFDFHGKQVTHETDEIYLVPTSEGTMQFRKDQMLVILPDGSLRPMNADVFHSAYERG